MDEVILMGKFRKLDGSVGDKYRLKVPEPEKPIKMYWSGTKKHPRVDVRVVDHRDAVRHARRLGLRIFHIFEDEDNGKMLGTWRLDVSGRWYFIHA